MQIIIESDKRPIVKATVNGLQAYFLVDTGASVNILDADRMKYFKFTKGRVIGTIIGSGGGSSENCLANNANVILAQTFPVYQWVTYSLGSVVDSIKAQTGIRIDGILGTPAIKQMEMKINLNDKIIKIGY